MKCERETQIIVCYILSCMFTVVFGSSSLIIKQLSRSRYLPIGHTTELPTDMIES